MEDAIVSCVGRCGRTGTVDDFSLCLICGGYVCGFAPCDCPCPVEFDNDRERMEFQRLEEEERQRRDTVVRGLLESLQTD